MRAALAALLCLAGCETRTQVEITLDIDTVVPLEQLGKLDVSVYNDLADVNRTVDFPPGFDSREARVVYYPKVTSGELQFQFTARTRDGKQALAFATGRATVIENRAVSLRAPLGPNFDQSDMSTIDLVGADMVLPPNDLAGADLVLPSNIAFEDSFESYGSIADLMTAGKWDVTTGGQTLKIDSQGARSSTRSFLIAHDGGSGQVDLGLGTKAANLSDPLWVRVFIKRQGSNPSASVQFLNVRTTGGGPAVALALHADNTLELSSYGGATSTTRSSATTLPTVFSCLEWYVDRPGHTMQVFLDGPEILDLRVTDLVMATPPDQVGLFVSTNQLGTGGSFSLVYDEFAFGSSRINCN